MIRSSLAFLVTLMLTLAPAAAQERQKRKSPVVSQVDRILVESGDPQSLFDLFSETLQMPVAWPITENPDYTSGSISTGEIVLEFFRYGARENTAAKARYTGLTFEPYPMEDALQELRIIGIPYDPPQIQRSILPNRSEGTAWTSVKLPTLSYPLMSVSLFEYSPYYLNVAVRRMQFRNRLTLDGGGPLGIVSTHLIVLESVEAEKDEAEWIRLLGKKKPDGYLHAVLGPAFQIVNGSGNRIDRIVLKVKSLDRAETFLKEKKLMGKKNEGEIYIDPAAIQGLKISVIEDAQK